MQNFLAEFIAIGAIGLLLYISIAFAAAIKDSLEKHLKLFFFVDVVLYVLPAIIDYIAETNNYQNNIIAVITAIVYIIAVVLSFALLFAYSKSKK